MPFKKGDPKPPNSGRRRGTVTSYAKSAFREFARELAQDEAYRAKLRERFVKGKVPPQVEVLLLHYAAGKPSDTVVLDATHRTAAQIRDMTDDELRARTLEVLDQLSPPLLTRGEDDDDDPTTH